MSSHKAALRESLASLYRGLDHKAPDSTYEKERLSVLVALRLVPDSTVTAMLGKTVQFDSSRAGLGMFARNRRERRQSRQPVASAADLPKKEDKAAALAKQNQLKRIAYAKELNDIVSTMGRCLTADETIPVNLWSKYDRLQRNPNYEIRTMDDVARGTATRTPGPGAYHNEEAEKIASKRGRALPTSFGASERWQTNTSRQKAEEEHNKIKGEATRESHPAGYANALEEKEGSRWSKAERQKLNDLYWELGRPRRPGREAYADHLDVYVKRHQVLFKNRPREEILPRVKGMLKFNGFKEVGEVEFWENMRLSSSSAAGGGTEGSSGGGAGLDAPPPLPPRPRKLRPLPPVPSGVGKGSDPGSGQRYDPPDYTSIGVQIMSERLTSPALSFLRAGVGGQADLSGVGLGETRAEPTATTYRPDAGAVKPRASRARITGRAAEEDGRLGENPFVGPGSYEIVGALGPQVESTKKWGGTVVIGGAGKDNFMKHLSDFAIA